MQIVVSNLLTNYYHSGKGRTVVLLHGWANSLKSFDILYTELVKNYEVIAVDLPGFGKSQTPEVAWDLDDYAEFINQFLKKLNIDNVYGILGHSNGGALAIRALATKKISARKLILLSSSGVRNKNSIKHAALKTVTKTGKVATFWLPNVTKQKLQKKLYGTIGSDMLVAPHMKETFKLTVRHDVQTDARLLNIPTILIYGDNDSATPLQTVGNTLHKQIRGSKLIIISGADHFAHQTHPEEVNKSILEFLK